MMRKNLYRVVGLIIMSMMVCSVGFALDIPDGVTHDPVMSGQALAMAKAQFIALKDQLNATAQTPDQEKAIEGAITLIDDKLEDLDRIDVYFADEDTPGEAYDRIYNFYKDQLSSMLKDVTNDDVKFVVTDAPAGIIPDATMNSLKALIDAGKVKAAAGTAGKSRISILTFYINPDTKVLIEGTTIVIATDK